MSIQLKALLFCVVLVFIGFALHSCNVLGDRQLMYSQMKEDTKRLVYEEAIKSLCVPTAVIYGEENKK